MSQTHLREFEELVLLSVRMRGDDASGVTIQQVLASEAGRDVSLGAIYTVLERLGRKGLVRSWLGEPTPVRGGRRRRHYRVTSLGLRHLTEIRTIRNSMWDKIGLEAVEEEAAP
jgi:DNA-binding PadR family transcriptional regulator